MAASGTLSKHRESTVSITLADDFFAALQSSDFRQAAGYTLINGYFEHAEQVSLYELTGIAPPEVEMAVKKRATWWLNLSSIPT